VDLGPAVDKLYGLHRKRFVGEREKLAKVEVRSAGPGLGARRT
jgi:hypothetical protein